MSKTKNVFSCFECGHTQPKWSGQCPTCSNWNTFKEEIQYSPGRFAENSQPEKKPLRIHEISEKCWTGLKPVIKNLTD